jgi:hypothetical protein
MIEEGRQRVERCQWTGEIRDERRTGEQVGNDISFMGEFQSDLR